MYGALMLAEFTKNDEDTEVCRKASVIDIDQYFFFSLIFWVFSNHHPSPVYKGGCICD